MRTKVLTIVFSMAALGLIGCGKGFESVKPERSNTILFDGQGGGAGGQAGTPIDQMDLSDAEVMGLVVKAVSLKQLSPEINNSLKLSVLLNVDADTILETSAVFHRLEDDKTQISISDIGDNREPTMNHLPLLKVRSLVTKNPVFLPMFESQIDAEALKVSLDLRCRDNCATVVSFIRIKLSGKERVTAVSFTKDAETGLYAVSGAEVAGLINMTEAAYSGVKEQLENEIANRNVEELQEIEVKVKKRETSLVEEKPVTTAAELQQSLNAKIEQDVREKLEADMDKRNDELTEKIQQRLLEKQNEKSQEAMKEDLDQQSADLTDLLQKSISSDLNLRGL